MPHRLTPRPIRRRPERAAPGAFPRPPGLPATGARPITGQGALGNGGEVRAPRGTRGRRAKLRALEERIVRRFALAFFALLASAPPAPAQVLHAGALVPAFALEDQHGTVRTVDASVRVLVLTRDMEAGEMVKSVLADDGAATLSKAGGVYVSDVSRMPGIIRSTIAEPRLRQRPYPVLLDREGDVTKPLPSAAGRPTVLVLEALRIVRVEEPMTPEALRALLDGLAEASPPAP